jgi:hypothetical protein
MWEDEPRLGPHLGFGAANRIVSPCGKIRQNLSTDNPQGNPFFNPFHILERVTIPAHIWGYKNLDIIRPAWTSPQGKILIHKKSRVIHISDV